MKNKLALVEYWNPRFHGVGCNEKIIRYFDIMEQLNFVTHIFSCDMNSLLFDNINNTINEENSILGFNRGLKLMILRGGFIMKGRMFGIPNKSFLAFISKMKKRYKRKIDIKKSIKALRYRECHGRYLKR